MKTTFVESNNHPNFYHPFGITDAVVSKDGEVINVMTGNFLKPIIRNHGYFSVNFKYEVDGRIQHRQYLIHRLLGLAFIPIPEKYKGVPLRKLQINHIDGDKLNNTLDNFEWCLAKKNMRHAFKNKLINIGRNVLARNIQTGEIRSYPSVAECSRNHDLNKVSLSRHLSSPMAGRKTKDWFVFKYDDGTDWYPLDPSKCLSDSWNLTNIVIAVRVEDNFIGLFGCLKDASEILGFDHTALKNHRVWNGISSPFKGWIFTFIDLSSVEDISSLKFVRRRFGRTSEKSFKVTDTATKQVFRFLDSSKVSKLIDYDRGYISDYVQRGKSNFGHFIVEPEHHLQTGLTHARV